MEIQSLLHYLLGSDAEHLDCVWSYCIALGTTNSRVLLLDRLSMNEWWNMGVNFSKKLVTLFIPPVGIWYPVSH
jgi:hypothetical protein